MASVESKSDGSAERRFDVAMVFSVKRRFRRSVKLDIHHFDTHCYST